MLQRVGLIVVIVIASMVCGVSWEIKTATGDSYSPPRFAISLRDHNSAFSSSAYCVSKEEGAIPYPNDLSRDHCDECASCTWKLRQGFTTEQEWRSAVSAEMARLAGEGLEPVGSWILEVPSTFQLNLNTMDSLSSSLGISLENLVVSEGGTRRFSVVSGTPRDITKVVRAGGFTSLTPIPPRLKIHPILEEEEAAEGMQPLPDCADPSYGGVSGGDSEEEWHGLRVELAPPLPIISPSYYSTSTSSSFSSSAATAATNPPPPLQLLGLLGSATNSSSRGSATTTGGDKKEHSAAAAAEWVGVVASRHGCAHTEVIVEGGRMLTVQGLDSRARAWAAALDIAQHGHVHWVAPHAPPTSSGYYASKLVQQWPPLDDGGDDVIPSSSWSTTIPPLHEMGLKGQGAVVGVAELGPMDFNSCFFEDEDVSVKFEKKKHKKRGKYQVFESTTHRKLRQYVVGHKKGYGGGNNGDFTHGTWVAGCIAGNPKGNNGVPEEILQGSGVAPEAKLAFFEGFRPYKKKKSIPKRVLRWFKPTYFGLIEDLQTEVFPRAYSVGVRVYSLSFGYSQGTFASYQLDAYCFRNQDFIVLVAAGNDGFPRFSTSSAGNIASPASAKSSVGVGSHSNLGGGPNISNRQVVLSKFSSRGPTADGRIKPEVCGPGEWVRAPMATTSAPGTRSCKVDYATGTSFAAPTVAGVTVLVRQYFTEGYYPTGVKDINNAFEPMGALLKAVLINSGRPVVNTAKKKDTPGRPAGEFSPRPNNNQGWGGVDVTTTLVTPGSHQDLGLKVFGRWSEGCADCPQLHEGQHCEYTFEVKKKSIDEKRSRVPLKVTLVWYDYQAHSGAREVNINNLDLSVTAAVRRQQRGRRRAIKAPDQPMEDQFFPNRLVNPDKKNTVEHITIPSLEHGTKFKVMVKGASVPMPAQPFALVVSGPFDSTTGEVSVVYHPKDGGEEEHGRCGG